MTTMEVYWKESYNIILIMGRWALAAMRKQKGERARAFIARKDCCCCCCMVCSKQWEKRAIAAARHTWAAQAERLRRGERKKEKPIYIVAG